MNYQQFIIKNNIRLENSFEYLYKNFIPTIATHSYLVDWGKVNENRKKYELLLNNLNFLLNKKETFKEDFEYLFRDNPSIIEAFPILLATRNNSLEFIDNEITLETKKYIFKKPNLINIDIVEHYYSFIVKTGLKDLFCLYNIKNLIDYVFGIEVGLNSNTINNRRSASTVENIVFHYLKEFLTNNNNFSIIKEATQEKIKECFDYNIEIDKNGRRFDFALLNNNNNNLYLIEVNFYNYGGGASHSRLKTITGEYKDLEILLKSQGITFIWIIDGKGCNTALNILQETFEQNDYVINLNMLKKDILNNICK